MPSSNNVKCPSCGQPIEPQDEQAFRCPSCNSSCRAYRFDPPPPRHIGASAMALDDDSACANHPTKKATAICDGTGDYICTLCAVDIGEKTYSTAYIDRVGVNSLDAPIQRHLKRPDRTVSLCFVLCLLIYFLGPAWVIWSVISFFQMLRYRKTEPIYRQIVGPGDVAVATILVLIPLTGWVFGIGAIVVGIMDT